MPSSGGRPGAAGSAPVPPERVARRARAGVAVLFFTNGAVFASVVPRYPDLKEGLGLSNTALGTAVSAFWVGALLVGLAGAALVRRWGSGRVAAVVTVAAAANLVLVGAAPSWAALTCALFLAGSFDTIADVAENAHALRVERLYHRSILNSLHGVWSIGAVTGGLAGTAAAGLRVPPAVHLPVSGAVCAVLAVAAARFLLTGPERAGATPSSDPPGGTGPARRRLELVLGVAALGTVATLAQGVEDIGATWSGVYLRGELGAAPATGGLAFIALQLAQTVGRLAGDRAVTRWGDRTLARAGATLAGTAVGAALAFPSPAATILGFGAAGLGIATLIPAAMRAADALPGLGSGVGLTLVGSTARIASLLSPPLIGLVADTASLRLALLLVPAAAVAVVLLAPALTTTRNARPGNAGPAGAAS